MKQSKSTSSIARRINLNFWANQLSVFLTMDFLILILVSGSFFYWKEQELPEDETVTERYFEDLLSYKNAVYVIETDSGQKYSFSVKKHIEYIQWPFAIFLAFQGIVLTESMFQTKKIRRTMKPLNDMARKAEELSNIAVGNKFSDLEHAISNLNPESMDARLSTGDKELQSLEVAINNLLERMRDAYRQQNRFVSDASHELRTPIAVIQGYVNMLDRWGKEDESILEESIEALKNETQHMKDLIEQLLFLARGDSGRNHLKIEEFVLTDIVREVYEESVMIDEKHCYRFQGEEGITMHGDIAMMKQSVRIFTDNAAKYSKEGDTICLSVKLKKDLEKKGENREWICYIIEDEGTGMAESEVSHIFERFYRSDSARNSRTGGTGLGLSIARWIVEAHEGVIEVLSRPEFGTRFTIRFPNRRDVK